MYSRAMNKALFITDTQCPFEHQLHLKLVHKIIELVKPDEIVLGGDMADCTVLGRYRKHPELPAFFMQESNHVNRFLDELQDIGSGAEWFYLLGNHEKRLANYIVDNCAALYGYLKFEDIFRLNARKMKWQDFSPRQGHRVLGSSLIARHCSFSSSAKASIANALCSIIHGHSHKMYREEIRSFDGNLFLSASPGWLGDPAHEIFDFCEKLHQWRNGIGIIYAGSDWHKYENIELSNGIAYLNGQVLTSL